MRTLDGRAVYMSFFAPITLDALVAVFATNSGIAPHMLHECCTAVPIGPAQAYASCVGAGEKARV